MELQINAVKHLKTLCIGTCFAFLGSSAAQAAAVGILAANYMVTHDSGFGIGAGVNVGPQGWPPAAIYNNTLNDAAGNTSTGRAGVGEFVRPDLVALGKSLSASLPLSAVAGRPEVLQSWKPGTHTSTFQGNPAACAAAVDTLETLESEALVQRADTTLAPMVLEVFKDRTVRVVGAQSALELGSPEAAIEVQKQALAEGILVYGSGSRLMLLPPLNIPEQAFAEALSRLRPLLPGPD